MSAIYEHDFSDSEINPGPDTRDEHLYAIYVAERNSLAGWVMVDDDDERTNASDKLAAWLFTHAPLDFSDGYLLDLTWDVRLTAHPQEASTDRGTMRWTDWDTEIIGLTVKMGDKSVKVRDCDLEAFEELLPEGWEQRLL